MNGAVVSNPSQRRYSSELKERAVRMVFALRVETGEKHGSVKRVADQLEVGVESLRGWVHQYEIDHGERAGVASSDAERIRRLEQENRELRRANEILRRASAFFAAELDRPPR
jgi:transposase